jgi:predicted nuclease of predicted toxin-antitoxin system
MKLLFDQNLSFKLCQAVADLFPESNHVGLLGLSEANDRILWDYAKANGFTIVSQDVDFAEMAALLGAPPNVIWLRAGNQGIIDAVAASCRTHRGVRERKRRGLPGNLLIQHPLTAVCHTPPPARSN